MGKRSFSIRSGLAAVAAAVLISGAAWHNLGATSQLSTPGSRESAVSSQQSAVGSQQSAVAGRIPGARDSYADVVKTVAPAVVTIRVEGKATAQPAQFDGDDFFRRFFGDDGD